MIEDDHNVRMTSGHMQQKNWTLRHTISPGSGVMSGAEQTLAVLGHSRSTASRGHCWWYSWPVGLGQSHCVVLEQELWPKAARQKRDEFDTGAGPGTSILTVIWVWSLCFGDSASYSVRLGIVEN